MMAVVIRVVTTYYAMPSSAGHWSKGFAHTPPFNSHGNSLREFVLCVCVCECVCVCVCLFMMIPVACASSWARGRIRIAAAGLCHSPSHAGSELHL